MRKFSKATLSYAAIVTLLVGIGIVSYVQEQHRVLPHPPGPTRTLLGQNIYIRYFCRNALWTVNDKRSATLARVVGIRETWAGVYTLGKKVFPRSDPKWLLPSVGEAKPVETLVGPTQSAPVSLPANTFVDPTRHTPLLGSDVLLLIDGTPGRVNWYMAVSGEDDPIVISLRLIHEWCEMPNFSDRLASAEAILINPRESETRRYTALVGIDSCPNFHMTVSQLQSIRHAKLMLLLEENLPIWLQDELLNEGLRIRPTKSERNADTDRLIAYMMRVVRCSHKHWKVAQAASVLTDFAVMEDTALKKDIVFPEIERCLQAREDADLGRKAPPGFAHGYRPGTGPTRMTSAVTEALVTYRAQVSPADKSHQIMRPLTTPPNDAFMRKLYAAAEK